MQKMVTFLNPNDLVLDINNPRFGELYTGSHKEDDLIEYLLFSESASALADRLAHTKEFYVDKPLLVFDDGKEKVVKDGNRRCAAVKALVNPSKYGLTAPSYTFLNLPVVVYTNKTEIENRIIEEHTRSLFKEWDRMAKALEVFRLFKTGSSLEAMEEIDSQPGPLIKLASFYYDAVKISGDNLKKLLRKGRGVTGGKAAIFERLFRYSDLNGYKFKNKPDYVIQITDKNKFKDYIEKIVKYLTNNPGASTRDYDANKEAFLAAAGLSNTVTSGTTPGASTQPQPGTSPGNVPTNSAQTPPPGVTAALPSSSQPPSSSPASPASAPSAQLPHINQVQRKPNYNRIIPGPLKKVIDECYGLNENSFTNAKIAMTRVAFECCLKYVIEETQYNGVFLKDNKYFKPAFPPLSGKKYTNFAVLKSLFENSIKNPGKKQAFLNFELEKPHTIIHNYNIRGLVNDANTLCDNLIPLIEFMLDNEATLLGNIDTLKF
ncbi:unnamed protein product [Didymodactylos carnosus]|uniref:Uncharacterized protein n=1 Tax=Didymodactylos carnosus TaxID=1234261 RepID=A0A814TKM7_9BILA|nr:unnamed protein product [Didymodactylos carnosus]CAF3927038.1 unnamed protein product [Didymodactylos carnosus]